MARRIAAEVLEVFKIRCKVGNTRIHRSAGAPHQPGKTLAPARSAWRFEYEPQPFFDQILELAATERRLRLGPAVKGVRNLNGSLHRTGLRHKTVKPYLWRTGPKCKLQ